MVNVNIWKKNCRPKKNIWRKKNSEQRNIYSKDDQVATYKDPQVGLF